MREVSLKNYVMLAIIFLVTIIAVFAAKKVYENNQEYENKTNQRMNILYEIKEDDIQSYLVENRDIIIYISKSSDESIVSFEEELKNYIARNEISREIIYLNLDQVSSNFYTNLKNKYFIDYLKANKDLPVEQANMLAIEDGKVKSILYEGKTTISLEDVKKFLQENDVVSK